MENKDNDSPMNDKNDGSLQDQPNEGPNEQSTSSNDIVLPATDGQKLETLTNCSTNQESANSNRPILFNQPINTIFLAGSVVVNNIERAQQLEQAADENSPPSQGDSTAAAPNLPSGRSLVDTLPTIDENHPFLMSNNSIHKPPKLYKMQSVSSIICRICQTADSNERLISPCLCKGTLAYVHKHCLEHWLNTSGILHCELCQYRYKTEQTLRYGCLRSFRLWFKRPTNRVLMQSELLVCSLLTVVSFGLIAISVLGLQYFVAQGTQMGMSKVWTQGSIIVFMLVVTFVYMVNVFLILKGQLVPWYRWWQSAKQVRVILYNRRSLLFWKNRSKHRGMERELHSISMSLTPARSDQTIITLNRATIQNY